jgi:hypothetical protein
VRGVKQTKVEKDGLTITSTQKAAAAIQGMVKLMAEQAK